MGMIVDDKGTKVVENSLFRSAHRVFGESVQLGTVRVAEERTEAVSFHFIYLLYISTWNSYLAFCISLNLVLGFPFSKAHGNNLVIILSVLFIVNLIS